MFIALGMSSPCLTYALFPCLTNYGIRKLPFYGNVLSDVMPLAVPHHIDPLTPYPPRSFRSVNVVEGEPNDRQMTTGNHTVRDIYCCKCGTTLGWKYVRDPCGDITDHLCLDSSNPSCGCRITRTNPHRNTRRASTS